MKGETENLKCSRVTLNVPLSLNSASDTLVATVLSSGSSEQSINEGGGTDTWAFFFLGAESCISFYFR